MGVNDECGEGEEEGEGDSDDDDDESFNINSFCLSFSLPLKADEIPVSSTSIFPPFFFLIIFTTFSNSTTNPKDVILFSYKVKVSKRGIF
jgi:hypothetical protein